MKKNFGNTWWGLEFLKSLKNIDHANRLTRGKAYAQKGAVSQIKIVGNEIKAQVKGSAYHPYRISILVPKFDDDKLNVFIQLLSQNPALISKLLNKELDPIVLAMATGAKLQVFPKDWNDFYMRCSCPDFAVPCKHLAAVIYTFSEELDNDPFLIFKLHGIDLANKFQKIGIVIKPQLVQFPTLIDLHYKPKKKPVKKKVEHQTHHKIDISTLPYIPEPLLSLLTDNPVFYGSQNFKIIYVNQFHKIVRQANKLALGKIAISEILPPLTQGSTLHPQSIIQVILLANGSKKVEISKQTTTVANLIQLLINIPIQELNHHQTGTQELYQLLLLAIHLVANGAIIPQFLQIETDILMIRWLPASLNEAVHKLIKEFEANCTLENFYIEHQNKPNQVNQDTAINLLSIFISELVLGLNQVDNPDIFTQLFFTSKPYKFHRPGLNKNCIGIQNWLQKYYIIEGPYQPQFKISEIEDEVFSAEILIIEKNKEGAEPIPLSNVFSDDTFKESRFEILKIVSQLGSTIPWLDDYINTQANLPYILKDKELGEFLLQIVPVIKLMNISVLLPISLKEIIKPKISMRVSKETQRDTFFRLDQILTFNWKIALGDDLIDEDEFNKLVQKSNGLIKYKANYIYVNEFEIEKIKKHFLKQETVSNLTLMRTALSGEYEGTKVELTNELSEAIKLLSEYPEIDLPKGLKAKLRPYQHRGYSWLYRNAKIGFGSLLADDMGLGKTIQIIALLLKYKTEGHFKKAKALIIVPTGLLTNWQAEIEKFAPKLTFVVFHGNKRELGENQKFDVVLSTYGTIRNDAVKLKTLPWHVVVIDEAQNIKNGHADQTKAVKSIAANHFIALSGTPVENRLSELYHIMDFTNRGILGNFKDFTEHYITPIQKYNNEEVAKKLMEVNAPFIMRRLKSDKSIISDLPDKIEINSYAHLEKTQAALYKETLNNALIEIKNIPTTDHQSLFKRQGIVLQMILALKQICNHPTQFLKNKVLKPELSGKMTLLFDKLDSILEGNEKVLIFTQFKEMGELLCHFIEEKYQEKPLFYHGSINLKNRKILIDNFQNNPADRIFVLTLKSAGTGLNLTSANHVIHYDLWWNPAVENQATDRAYRIGQNKNVMVHRFITKNTFEERINELIQNKKTLANMTVSTGESWIGNLSNDELKELFTMP
ncbi:MAG: DEAD/DEAH box helicase [Bacteroidota bacterium]|nr:DEAD/DEAH box helicase [Bacteroidota bacterium]